jgi:hypothetical protein
MVRLVRAAVLAAAALSLAAPGAQAQFGGLKERLKQKVAEKTVEKAAERGGLAPEAGADSTRGAAPAAPAAASPRARAASEPAARSTQPEEPVVLPLTLAVLDRYAASLEVERVEREAAAQRRKVEEQKGAEYSACMVDAMSSPGYMKASEHMQAAADKNDMKAYAAAVDEQMGAIRAKCGEQPTYEDPARAIHAKALEAGHFSERQYTIVEERVLPFCKIKGRGGFGYEKLDPRLVYSDEERSALTSRCDALSRAFDAVR